MASLEEPFEAPLFLRVYLIVGLFFRLFYQSLLHVYYESKK